jgi:hypothetical protein
MGNQNRIIFIPMRLKNILNESTTSDIIKDLDKVKNDLLKKVDVLVAKKKKLYSDVDIESPMSADEKKLDKDIADLFSQINTLVLQKRSLKKESINEAINPEVFREFMQACNDAGLNSFQIFGMHVLVYILTLGATGATILSALGIAQLAKDAKDTFNNWNAGRKLNPQKVKEIVKDFENKVNKLEGGRKRFFQGIINKMKKANPEDKSSLVSINKDLKYYADRYNLDNESVNEGKYYIGYNKGRGQGTGVFKDVFPTYKDAKKELEKIEKQRGGSYNQIAYYVADEKGNFVREVMLGEGRGIKSIQNDLDKTVVAIESEIASYKATKGTPQEKKHIDNLKKLHPIKKKLQSELDMAVSGLYRDAELKIED